MSYREFYKQLFKPIRETVGEIDADTLVAIIGFDAGGPLNFCTVHHGGDSCVTYVSCELAVRDAQPHKELAGYELMITSDDETWVRSLLTDIGWMTLDATLDHGHTLDIGPWVGEGDAIQGVVFERFATVTIDRQSYGLLYCHGVTRPELAWAMRNGVDALLAELKKAGVYPTTPRNRERIAACALPA